MTQRPIGYYVHHHGAGHRARAIAIRDAIDRSMTLIGTGIGRLGLDLADDRIRSSAFDGVDGVDHRPDALHYVPIDHEGIRSRVACVTGWIAKCRPSLMVVDVSVEIAMLARLASVPTIYVRLSGDRTDPPHLEAFRGARALLAPFHSDLEPASTPAWVRAKTAYFPGISASKPASPDRGTDVLVIQGNGAGPGNGDRIADAARACPALQWRVIGHVSAPRRCPANLVLAGWSDAPSAEIAAARVVVGAAGDGFVNAVLSADRPLICIPEPRPFDEQRMTALRLADLGAAVVNNGWPAPDAWAQLIADALALDPAPRRRLADGEGAAKAAAWLSRQANPSVGADTAVAA